MSYTIIPLLDNRIQVFFEGNKSVVSRWLFNCSAVTAWRQHHSGLPGHRCSHRPTENTSVTDNTQGILREAICLSIVKGENLTFPRFALYEKHLHRAYSGASVLGPNAFRKAVRGAVCSKTESFFAPA